MSPSGPAGRLLLALSAVALRTRAAVWPVAQAIGRFPPLARLRAAIGRLPPGLALPLFLAPELCSRGGWAGSAWLLLSGYPWRAAALYAATKLLAGGAALWIYAACEPALLRVAWFAALHGAVGRIRRSVLAGVRAWVGWDAAVAQPSAGKPPEVPHPQPARPE